MKQLFRTDSVENCVLLLVCILPFLVPFSLLGNIVLQGVTVSLIGLLSWGVVFGRRHYFHQKMSHGIVVWLSIYLVGILVSLALNHFSVSDLLGTDYARLGVINLVASVGCGLTMLGIPSKRLFFWLYSSIVVQAVLAIPYSIYMYHGLTRLGGFFDQSDIFAVFMASGLFFGSALQKLYPRYRRMFVCSQSLLLVILALTQTRAVLGLFIGVSILLIWRIKTSWRQRVRYTSGLLAAIVLLLLCMLVFLTGASRVVSPGYAYASGAYRLDLQAYGVKALPHKPLGGYGTDDIAGALSCPSLHNAALQTTCQQGHYFDSSHNIYLDRLLALGWVSGLAFLVIVVSTVYRGLRAHQEYNALVMTAVTLLIACYYFTNVTNLELELLFWIVLLRPWHKESRAQMPR